MKEALGVTWAILQIIFEDVQRACNWALNSEGFAFGLLLTFYMVIGFWAGTQVHC